MIVDRDLTMDMWCVCPTTALADANNYYTKKQVDDIVIEAGAITPEIVSGMIEDYGYDKAVVDAISGTLDVHISNMDIHTTEEEKASWNEKADFSDIPTEISELTNDLNFVSATVEGTMLILE